MMKAGMSGCAAVLVCVFGVHGAGCSASTTQVNPSSPATQLDGVQAAALLFRLQAVEQSVALNVQALLGVSRPQLTPELRQHLDRWVELHASRAARQALMASLRDAPPQWLSDAAAHVQQPTNRQVALTLERIPIALSLEPVTVVVPHSQADLVPLREALAGNGTLTFLASSLRGTGEAVSLVQLVQKRGYDSDVMRRAVFMAKRGMNVPLEAAFNALTARAYQRVGALEPAHLQAYAAFFNTASGQGLRERLATALDTHLTAALPRLARYLAQDPQVPLNLSGYTPWASKPGGCTQLAACKQQCTREDAQGCLALGLAADTGTLGALDVAQAAADYGRACDLGSQRACVLLGVALATGRGVAEDPARARALFQRACARGDDEGCANAARQSLADARTAEARQQARREVEAGCGQGRLALCPGLAWFQVEGVAGAQDTAAGVQTLTRACERGEVLSCRFLGNAYRSGWGGLPVDAARAVAVFRQGCDLGELGSCNNLGTMLEDGRGVEKDLAAARELYVQACEHGEPPACVSLGELYRQGLGVAANVELARTLFRDACEDGFRPACGDLEKLDQH